MRTTRATNLAVAITVFVAALALPPSVRSDDAADDDVDRFLRAWSESLGEVTTLEVRFEQEKRLRILKRPLVSKGVIRVAEGKLLCSTYDRAGELETALALDGKTMRLYYPRLKRLEVFEVGAARAPGLAFPVFGADPEAIRRDFAVSLARDGDRARLELVPKDDAAPFVKLVMRFEGGEVKEVEQHERGGNEVRLKIVAFERGAKLAAKDLELSVAPGTRTVRPLEK